jgi:hypothetical protein
VPHCRRLTRGVRPARAAYRRGGSAPEGLGDGDRSRRLGGCLGGNLKPPRTESRLCVSCVRSSAILIIEWVVAGHNGRKRRKSEVCLDAAESMLAESEGNQIAADLLKNSIVDLRTTVPVLLTTDRRAERETGANDCPGTALAWLGYR